MAKDKYSAVWVSHSSISDYLHCPRAYFLHHVYREPVSGKKISLTGPPLALGQVVHQVLEALSVLPVDRRFEEPLLAGFEQAWLKVSGEKGGFESKEQEKEHYQRGREMITRVVKNPGPLGRLAVKIKTNLPYYWLSEKDNIILCGKIDWLEYLADENAVHIIDFKTGRGTESQSSLQLPIYHLLVHKCQQRKVVKASYWYLARDNQPTEQKLPNLKEAHERILKIAKRIKLVRQLEKFDCPEGKNGCRYCQPLEKILRGEALFVGENDFGHNVYILKKPASKKVESEIL